MTRRDVLKTALAATPAALMADTPAGDRPRGASKPVKITKVEVLQLEKPLKERFWMANSPIGGYKPKASRLIVTIHTDAGISGHGEGSGGGADLFRKAAGRAAILFLLGVLVYVYPEFNLSTERILGVLQRIAICYLAAAAIFLTTKLRGQIVWITVGHRQGPKQRIFTAMVDQVDVKPLRELSQRDIERDTPEFRRVEDTVNFLSQIYSREVSLDDIVSVVHFTEVIEFPPLD